MHYRVARLIRQMGALLALTLPMTLLASEVCAQSSTQFWPELQLHYSVDDRTKVIAMVAGTTEGDGNGLYEGQVGLSVDHRFDSIISGRLGYRHGFAMDGGSFREDRLLLEQYLRFNLPLAVGLEFRTRGEMRWLDTGTSARFRERVMLQREFHIDNYAFSPYVSGEIYFDTRFDQFNRYRLTVGATFPISGSWSVEPNFSRQADSYPNSSYVNAFGLVVTSAF